MHNLESSIHNFQSHEFKFERLKYPGPYPVGIDIAHREMYLSNSEFYDMFNMTKEEFLLLPKWKQLSRKKKYLLF